MKLSSAVQESLVALLCHDDENHGVVAALVPPKSYDPIFAELAEAAIDYRSRYDSVAGEHTLDLVASLVDRDEEKRELFEQLYDSLESVKDGINAEYVVKQASTFARFQRMKRGLAGAVRSLKTEDEEGLLKAEGELAAAIQPAPDSLGNGFRLTELERSLQFLEESYQPFDCGIAEIDKWGHGPCRKRLHLTIGLTGIGKSWWLIHVAKHALLQRLRVLYVTLEMDEHEVAQRMFQALYSIRKRGRRVDRIRFEKDDQGRYKGFELVRVKGRPHLKQSGIRKLLKDKVESTRRIVQNFYVAGFPEDELTPRTLEAYLDVLQQTQSFIPDLILIDYIDLMGADQRFNEERFRLGSITKRVRALGKKRNAAMVSVTQSNREGTKEGRLDLSNVSEDFSKTHHADIVFTISQTELEREYGFARLFVAKGRSDRAKMQVLLSQSYDLGQFCMDSVPKGSEYLSDMKDIGGSQ